MPKVKFYAVKRGRLFPAVHSDWHSCKANVSQFPGAIHRSFNTMEKAEEWLAAEVPIHVDPTPPFADPPPRPKYFPALSKPKFDPAQTAREKRIAQEEQEKKLAEDPAAVLAGADVVRLSPEQQMIMNQVKEGQCVFFTGSAGTGKSVLLREIINHFGGSSDPSIGITATTGIAAVNIGGVTLHSWAGIGVHIFEPGKSTEQIGSEIGAKILASERHAKAKERWQGVKALIIDEISMLDGKLFEVLEAMGRRIRHHDAAFGGIQLIICGDFCQLPPVTRNEKELKFAFEARTWKECVPHPIMLTKVFRQKDEAFARMLNRMRLGQIDGDMVSQFTALAREVQYDDGIEPTELYPRREQVERANSLRLEKLPGRLIEYESSDRGGVDSNGHQVRGETLTKVLERLLAPPVLGLKIGAQVMLIRNLLQGVLVNGSVGRVIDFQPEGSFNTGSPSPERRSGRRSRSKSPVAGTPLYPLVRFTNGYTKLITPVNFEIPNASGGLEALRCQVPLILAWGLSMHKSQGQTLERVKVNLNGVFECGQAYVAISRATKMDTLQVIGFRRDKIRTHPRVLSWMESELGYGAGAS